MNLVDGERGREREREGASVHYIMYSFFWYTHLGLFHTHLAFVSVAMETICDLPHPLARTDPLYKVGWEQSHLVSAFPLVNTHGR